MDTLYGYAGKLLRVDLSNERVTEEKLDEETTRKYVGGTGFGAKYLFEEVPAGVDWSDDGNRMIMATGPVGGTRLSGSGTFSVVTKGPLTNGAVASQANGFFGAFLKFSGYDGIIIQGKAKKWTYLYIHDGKAELRDASHLAGKETWETGDLIKNELGMGEGRMSVASIGPAGENLVKFAAIFVDRGHVASHGGVGAVMGSKKLKAVAVARGNTRPSLKDEQGLSAINDRLHKDILSNPAEAPQCPPIRRDHFNWGTLSSLVNGTRAKNGFAPPVKNYTTSINIIEPEKLEKFGGPYIRSHFEPKPNPCWACQFHHDHRITLTEGPFKGHVGVEPEYEDFASFGPVIGVTDATAAIFLANLADRLGIDANETGWTVGLVMECYEKGILKREDCDGLEMTWGNYDAVNELMHKIAGRQGFGNVLAEGAMRAAQRIGGEAPNFAIHTMKGNTPRTHDHRANWGMLFDTCLSQMATDEGSSMVNPVNSEISLSNRAGQFGDCLGWCLCHFDSDTKLCAEVVTAATGWDFTIEEALTVNRRIVNLLRVFNIRHGHTAEMDAPSPRYGSAPLDGPAQGKTIMPSWNEMRRKYYELMGWDKETGKPLPDTLRRYGLESAIPELWGK